MPKKLATGERKSRLRGRSTPKRELLDPHAGSAGRTVPEEQRTMVKSIRKAAGRLAKAKSGVASKSGDRGTSSVTKLKTKATGKKAGRQARRLD